MAAAIKTEWARTALPSEVRKTRSPVSSFSENKDDKDSADRGEKTEDLVSNMASQSNKHNLELHQIPNFHLFSVYIA